MFADSSSASKLSRQLLDPLPMPASKSRRGSVRALAVVETEHEGGAPEGMYVTAPLHQQVYIPRGTASVCTMLPSPESPRGTE
jgi:hypothetical protein